MQSEPSLRSEDLSCRCRHPQGEHRPYTDGGCTQCVCKTFQLGEQQPVVINNRCKCSHDRFRHCYDTVDGPCSKPDCDCGAYAPVTVETVELPEAECPTACREGHTYSGSCMNRADGPRPGPCRCGCAAGAHMGRPNGCREHGLHEYEPAIYCPDEAPVEPGCHPPDFEGECPCTTGCGCCKAEPFKPYCRRCDEAHEPYMGCLTQLPPQPERRPPLSVAYSTAGGHLYEVYVPGDASVTAEDGALIIQHPEAQVLAIVRVAPIKEA